MSRSTVWNDKTAPRIGTVATSAADNSRHDDITCLTSTGLSGGGTLVEMVVPCRRAGVPLFYLGVHGGLELAKGILMSLPAGEVAEDHELRQILKMCLAYNREDKK